MIAWVDIADVVDQSLQGWPGTAAESVDAVLLADRQARDTASTLIAERMA